MSKKLCPCKVCGQQIAKNAKICPHCGGKNKKKHPLFVIILAIVIIALIVSISERDEVPQQESYVPEVQIEPVVEEITEVEAEVEEVTREITEAEVEVAEATEEATEEVLEETAEIKAEQGIRSEFKEAMDSYEDFFAEYCSFMEKYQKNPTDVSLLADYAKFMAQYVETMEEMEALEDTDMNDEELKYYIEVTARINQMLVDVAI